MKLLEEFFLILTDPVKLLLSLICIMGTSPIGRKTQPKTMFQLYDIFVRTIKLFYRHLAIQLRFNFDDDGNTLSDHELFLRAKVPTLKDFRIAMDQHLGAAHVENRPTAKGYGYPNIYVKEVLIFWLHSVEVRGFFKDFDALLETMDRIQTVEDSMASVEGFQNFAGPYITNSLNSITEKGAIAMSEMNPTTMQMLFYYNFINQSGNQIAVQA